MLNMENYELKETNLEEEMIVGATREEFIDFIDAVLPSVEGKLGDMEDGDEKQKLIDKMAMLKKLTFVDGFYFSTPDIYAPKGTDDEWEPEDDEEIDLVVKMPMYIVLKGTAKEMKEFGLLVDKIDNEDN